MVAPVVTGDVLALGSSFHTYRPVQISGASSNGLASDLGLGVKNYGGGAQLADASALSIGIRSAAPIVDGGFPIGGGASILDGIMSFPPVAATLGAIFTPGNAGQEVRDQVYGPYASPGYTATAPITDGVTNAITGIGSGATVPPLPTDIVGDTSDPRFGPNKGGGRVTTGPLRPEYGGTGDYDADLQTLTGGTRASAPGDSAPSGAEIGENKIFGRPNDGSGARIDIPANGSKPHETLHYPN